MERLVVEREVVVDQVNEVHKEFKALLAPQEKLELEAFLQVTLRTWSMWVLTLKQF
jgi:hypothetical protein